VDSDPQTENPRVGGAIPSLGTTEFNGLQNRAL